MQRPLSQKRSAVVTREWRKKNPEKQRRLVLKQLKLRPSRASTRARRAAHRANGKCIHHGLSRAFGSKRCLLCWDIWCQKRYGIDVGIYATMLVSQGLRCKICGLVKTLMIDHCHRTLKVRELICNRCNVLVGYMETSSEGLLGEVRTYLAASSEGGVQ